ncbi:MAG: ThiF family adenylyltransferase [Verrucomicrobia bacterium]|nr:ThiF family adenylyltransferase [Verrucomicrobiota bacterium]
MKPIHIIQDGRETLWRITEADREKLLRLLFHRYPDSEWGTFFRFCYRRTRWGILVTWVDALKPESGDLDRNSPLVEFRPAYIRRALTALETDALGVGVIHSHPQDSAPLPSRADDDMDSYFAGEFECFGNGRPYASLIVARNADRKLSFSGRVFDRGDWLPVKNCLVVGEQLLREKARQESDFFAFTREPAVDGATQERLTQLLGTHAPQRLRNAVVGIVGCSGTGSPAIHLLARAEIGELVMVDPGQFKPSNHQRNHASRHADLSVNPAPTKVALASRLVREISPATKVTGFVGDLLDEVVLDELVHCDLILGCTDSNYARAALGDIASHYLVPVLDLAVQMRAENGILREQIGEIARYAPGLPCPWCRGRVSVEGIRYETATDAERQFRAEAAAAAEQRGVDGAQYWGGTPPPELTVGYLTTTVGAMGAGYAQNLLLGSAKLPHNRFQFDLGLGLLAVVTDDRLARQDCACQRNIGWSDQARADRSVSLPDHWSHAKQTTNNQSLH